LLEEDHIPTNLGNLVNFLLRKLHESAKHWNSFVSHCKITQNIADFDTSHITVSLTISCLPSKSHLAHSWVMSTWTSSWIISGTCWRTLLCQWYVPLDTHRCTFT